MCRKAIPRETSRANFTACVWSTTKSGERRQEGQETSGIENSQLGQKGVHEMETWEMPPPLLPSCS